MTSINGAQASCALRETASGRAIRRGKNRAHQAAKYGPPVTMAPVATTDRAKPQEVAWNGCTNSIPMMAADREDTEREGRAIPRPTSVNAPIAAARVTEAEPSSMARKITIIPAATTTCTPRRFRAVSPSATASTTLRCIPDTAVRCDKPATCIDSRSRGSWTAVSPRLIAIIIPAVDSESSAVASRRRWRTALTNTKRPVGGPIISGAVGDFA